MKQQKIMEAIDLIDDVYLNKYTELDTRYRQKHKKASKTTWLRFGTVAATLCLVGIVMFAILIPFWNSVPPIVTPPSTTSALPPQTTEPKITEPPITTEPPFAFMKDDRFVEVIKEGYLAENDPAFRHDVNAVTMDDTKPVAITANIPRTFTINGVEYEIGEMLNHVGRTVTFTFYAPKLLIHGYNDNDLPLIQFDAITGNLVGISDTALDTSPGLQKTESEYIIYAKNAIKEYMPYVDIDGLEIISSIGMKDHNDNSNTVGMISFNYRYQNIDTIVNASVMFYKGTIWNLHVTNYCDYIDLLTQKLTIDVSSHEDLLISFAKYSCNNMEFVKYTLSESKLVKSVKGNYALEYTIMVYAKKDISTRKQMFNIQIEIE